MCCAMFLVCPSIAIHRTYQFWARSESVNMPKTICSSAKCGVPAVFRFLYSEQATRNAALRHCPSWQCSATYCSCNKVAPEPFSMWSVWSSTGAWLPVIFISFLVWNCRRRTKFWHNELQTSVKNWLKAQASGFYDEGIEKLVPRYKKCLRRSVDYIEKWLVGVAKCCK